MRREFRIILAGKQCAAAVRMQMSETADLRVTQFSGKLRGREQADTRSWKPLIYAGNNFSVIPRVRD